MPKKLKASVTVEQLTFSDGTSLDISDAKLIVFVGPNNAGKSAALKEIESHAQSEKPKRKVLKSASLIKKGTAQDIAAYIEAEYQFDDSRGNRLYSFVGGQIWAQTLSSMWEQSLGELTRLFINKMSTDERLSECNPVEAVDTRRQVGNKSIHAMRRSETVEAAVSAEFKKAFDLRLYVDRFGGSRIGLRVGKDVEILPGEDRISDSYGRRFEEQTTPLEEQGDGMRAFATVVSNVLAFDSASILLIDEPEAFLHPPQARLIGEFLSNKIPEGRQVFVATHSPDLLIGAMTKAPKKTLVVRIEREGDINYLSRLENKLAEEISSDPILMHSQVLDGVFHERVFVCEADADNMFYRAVLHAVAPDDEKHPDVHFCQSGGKSRMPSILTALRGLSVRTDAIVDIDALNDAAFFQKLVEAAGGEWTDLQSDYKQVFDSVEALRGVTKIRDLQNFFVTKVSVVDADTKIDPSLKTELNRIFAEASPWGQAKKSGASVLPNGEPRNAFNRLSAKCGEIGIWLVDVGELERFCPSVGGHGPLWAQSVLSTKDVKSDPELEAARKFIEKIWRAKRQRRAASQTAAASAQAAS